MSDLSRNALCNAFSFRYNRASKTTHTIDHTLNDSRTKIETCRDQLWFFGSNRISHAVHKADNGVSTLIGQLYAITSKCRYKLTKGIHTRRSYLCDIVSNTSDESSDSIATGVDYLA